jgi:hypothetical protein
MSLNPTINYDRYVLDNIYLTDMTAYPINGVVITDVQKTRFLFATVDSINNASSVTTLLAGVEYELVGTGNITVNGRTLSAGTTFVLMNDATPTIPTTLTINQTGYYTSDTNYLPIDTTDATFTPSQAGDGNVLYFNDAVRFIRYEIYTTQYSTGLVTASSGDKFIVKGAESTDSITFGGGTYYVGEVFSRGTNFTFAQGVNNIGTCYVVKYNDEVEISTWTDKLAYSTYQSFVQSVANSNFSNTNLIGNYMKVYSLLNSLYLGAERDVTFDPQAMQQSLDTINNLYANVPRY